MRQRLSAFGSLGMAAALLVPAGTALAQEASPTAEATLAPAAQAFAEAFPDEIGGVALADLIEVASADAPDVMDAETLPLLEEVIVGLGVGLDAVLVGQAATFTDLFDEDGDGVWIIAIQIPGMDPATGSDLMLGLFTASGEEDLVITETEVAERSVTRVASTDDSEAAFIIYAVGDIAWVVATQSTDLLEETISKLP